MKKVVKRFLLNLPIMFCMVLGLAVPAVSSAFEDSDFYSYSDLYSDFSNSSDYIVFKFESIQNYGTSLWTCGVFLSGFDYSVSSSGSIYTISVPHNNSSTLPFYYMYRNFGDTRTPRTEGDIHSFTFNIDTSELHFYSSSGEEIDSFVPSSSKSLFDCQYDLEGVSAGLNVSVEFQPALSGSVDRTITNGSGASGLSQQLKMIVTNNSRCAIQYDMQIVKTEQTNLRDWTSLGSYSSAQEFNETAFDDDPIFIYYDNDWVYAHSLDDSGSYFNGIPTKQQKSTQYHYLAAGASDDVTFNYSQINLQEGCSYTVTVRAVRCDYDCASELLINAIEDVYPEMKQISLGDLEVVYSSSFSMLHYKDVKYDPSDSSNGVVPYDGSKGLSFKERYANSYNAVQNSSGQVDYTSKNLYDDPNSFWNKTYDPSSYSTLYPNYRSGFNNTPSSVNNLSASISNFGSFLQSIFSYFPSGVFAIFNLALVMVVIIAIIKVVR